MRVIHFYILFFVFFFFKQKTAYEMRISDWSSDVCSSDLPEVEFYLVSQNTDPDFPLTPPTGQSGRSESASQPYGLEAMNEYEDIIDHIYDDCELMGLDIDTMIHEMGAAQLEVNFIHGDPLRLADEEIGRAHV